MAVGLNTVAAEFVAAAVAFAVVLVVIVVGVRATVGNVAPGSAAAAFEDSVECAAVEAVALLVEKVSVHLIEYLVGGLCADSQLFVVVFGVADSIALWKYHLHHGSQFL